MTGPEKTGLIYAKYMCSYYGKYLVFWMCYSQSFIKCFIDFYIYDKRCAKIQNIIKKLLQFKHSKLGQILCVDKTFFSGPVTNITCTCSCVYTKLYKIILRQYICRILNFSFIEYKTQLATGIAILTRPYMATHVYSLMLYYS